MVATSAIPAAGLEYLRRLRELKYHEFLFEILSKQYEAARIDESQVAPALQLVDAAIAPDKKSGPPRGLIVLLGLFITGAVASIIVYAREGNGTPTAAEKLRVLGSLLSVRGSLPANGASAPRGVE